MSYVLSPSSTGHEQVCLEAKMRSITEICSIKDDLTRCKFSSSAQISGQSDRQRLTWQFYVLFFYFDQVTFLAQFRRVEVADRYTKFCQTNKLFSVESNRVGQYARTIDDGNSFV
jgi:hypothetical protein